MTVKCTITDIDPDRKRHASVDARFQDALGASSGIRFKPTGLATLHRELAARGLAVVNLEDVSPEARFSLDTDSRD